MAQNALGENYLAPEKITMLLAIAVLILVYALRGRTGTDTPGYISSFYRMGRKSFANVLQMHDPAFYLLTWVDYRICFGNIIAHNIILGIITYGPIIYLYIKYSENYSLMLALYIVTTGYYFAFNGQRQAVAIGICIIGYISLMKKNYKAFIFWVIVAYFFHSTALFIIPVGLISTWETESKKFIFVATLLFISAIAIGSLWDRLFELLGMMGQDRLVEEYAGKTEHHGANILRFLVLLVPVIIGCIFYRDMKKHYKNVDLVLNMNIIGTVFMLAGNFNWLFARLSAYTAPLIPVLLVRCGVRFDNKSKSMYYMTTMVLYLLYMWVYVHRDSDLIPYRFMYFGSY